jgi:hypothetical protein
VVSVALILHAFLYTILQLALLSAMMRHVKYVPQRSSQSLAISTPADPLIKKTQENSGLNVGSFNQTADSAGKDDVGAFPDVMSFAGLAPEIMCVQWFD